MDSVCLSDCFGLQVFACHRAGFLSIYTSLKKMLLSMVSVPSLGKVRDDREKVL